MRTRDSTIASIPRFRGRFRRYTIPGHPCKQRVLCIRKLRQHLVHAFSSRPSSSADFPERVDSICRAICSRNTGLSTHKLGVVVPFLSYSVFPILQAFRTGYKTLRAFSSMLAVYTIYV